MDLASTRRGLYENVVSVPTTIWKKPGELDLPANAENVSFQFRNGVTAMVAAGGVGEHDRLSIPQQIELLTAIAASAREPGNEICLGTGIGRTTERVSELAPALAEIGISWAMLMPPAVDDPDQQFEYYARVTEILHEHSVWAVPYPRPEHPMPVAVIQRLFDQYEFPAVKLANNGMLLAYAGMVDTIGHDRCAWLCGTAGWWMPAYEAVGAARGMSSGIVNAFPTRPGALLQRILQGSFERDTDYWTMVKIEQIRQRQKSNIALVIKYMQECVGLKGGMNADGSELSAEDKKDVLDLLKKAGWLE